MSYYPSVRTNVSRVKITTLLDSERIYYCDRNVLVFSNDVDVFVYFLKRILIFKRTPLFRWKMLGK